MIDMEKVIKGLEGMIDYFFNIYRNDTDSYKCAKAQEYSDCAIDAIALLKEQEAVKPKEADNPEESEYCCGICGYPLWLDELYCAHCGRRIEWEGR